MEDDGTGPDVSIESRLEALHGRSFGWALACCDWDREEAADVLQGAYLKVLDGRARFGGRSSFSTWLFGVVRVTAAERRRKRLRRRLLLLENPFGFGEPPRSEAGDALEAERLRAALRALPRRQREVLHLVFYSDLSIAEAAETMGVGLGTARTHYERGKRQLRSVWVTEGEGR